MSDREVFRSNLVDLMNRSKAKQIDIARYAEVSYQTVSAWVCGRGYPRAEAMEKLCKFFGVKQSALTETQSNETQEDKLVSIYRALPQAGKDKLMERAEELRLLMKRSKRNGKAETEK